mmetsp:Transcript_8740/g.20622  ORF Transcript_8740/g.20622 Transcript_8740/m.20622 type:complete len:215 (-) Transcript_8740:755-1399(-)
MSLMVTPSSLVKPLSSRACTSPSSCSSSATARYSSSSSCVMRRSPSSLGSKGSAHASGIVSGSDESTGRGSVAGKASSPLQMTHMSCASVRPTTQWCSCALFLRAAQCSTGTHSKPLARMHWRTTPAESTVARPPASLKPTQCSVAPGESGSGAVASRTGRAASRMSKSTTCMLWSAPLARPSCCTSASRPCDAAIATSGALKQSSARCAPVCE